ncbi:DUF397 domain-containing protein [Kitasatospora sp. NPDC058965]|uniref:DUF397 domain-containing protein n=1 Tax=Kitasatospora sp. NPDC058965 TaxID=3346682 RepID=UPI0036C71873
MWRKSSYSQQGGECIEVADGFVGATPVRDSKDPHGPVLTFPDRAFAAFLAALTSGRLVDRS